jgi:hypothetical protein
MHRGHVHSLLDTNQPVKLTAEILEEALRTGVENGILTLVASECILHKPKTYYYALDRTFRRTMERCLSFGLPGEESRTGEMK